MQNELAAIRAREKVSVRNWHFNSSIPFSRTASSRPGKSTLGFTRTLTAEQSRIFSSRVLYRDPLMVLLPRSRRVKSNRVRVADLANERFILFHREGYPGLFDTTIAMCQKAGFNPRVENQPNNLQTVLSLVEAEQGVSIVPACAETCVQMRPVLPFGTR